MIRRGPTPACAEEAGSTAAATRRLAMLLERGALGGCVLDVGSGSGEFLSAVSPHVQSSCGVEPDDTLARAASRRCIVTFSSLEQVPEAPFTLVTLFDRLHLAPRPSDLVVAVAARLAPGGLLAAEVPAAMTREEDGLGSRLTGAALEGLALEAGLDPTLELLPPAGAGPRSLLLLARRRSR